MIKQNKHNKKAKLIFTLVFCCTFIFSAGCKKNPKPIVIAVIEPLSGDSSSGGEQELRGVQIANLFTPEVLGRPVEIVPLDLTGDLTQSTKIASDFIAKNKPVAIIGSYGNKYTAELEKALDGRKIPIISPTSTSVSTTANPYLFKLMYTDAEQATLLATFAVEELGAKKVGIVIEQGSEYSMSLATAFEKVFVALSPSTSSVVDHIFYEPGTEDFNSHLTQLSQGEPDIIFAPGNAQDCAKLISQARQLGVTQPFLGGDIWHSNTLLTFGGETIDENIYFATLEKTLPLDSALQSKFSNEFYQKFSQSSTLSSELSFDAYNIVIASITKTNGVKGDKLKSAIASNVEVSTITGNISFGDNGAAKRTQMIMHVVDGVFTRFVPEPKTDLPVQVPDPSASNDPNSTPNPSATSAIIVEQPAESNDSASNIAIDSLIPEEE